MSRMRRIKWICLTSALVVLINTSAVQGKSIIPGQGVGMRTVSSQAKVARPDASIRQPAEGDTDTFRISTMGGIGDDLFVAQSASVAYNSQDNEYLVVWTGSNQPEDVDLFEIFGQRIDAATGEEVSVDDFQISSKPADAQYYAAAAPAVIYNSRNNEYLAVWWREYVSADGIADYDVFGQRLDAEGNAIGVDNFRISDMDDIDTGTSFLASGAPGLAYNRINNEYFVVWFGEDDVDSLVDWESEIFGQRLDAATGAEVGAHNFRISDVGGLGNNDSTAWEPDVVWNSLANEYLVVWLSDDNAAGLVANEFEVFGQRIDAATGMEVGVNDFRISDMGGIGNNKYGAGDPTVAFNSVNHEYLVVWSGEDNVGGLVQDEREIFGQRLKGSNATEIGANDFRISDMGGTGNPNFDAFWPAVTFNPNLNEYLIVWHGDDDVGLLVEDEYEIFGQRLDAATAAQVGENDFRISDMGPDGDPDYVAELPDVIYGAGADSYLVVWDGTDDRDEQLATEFEIFGQRYGVAAYTYLPLLIR